MKKTMMVLALAMVLVPLGLFANGGQETKDQVQPELLDLTGTLVLEEGQPVQLVADGVTYTLMFPYLLLQNVEVTNGESVIVQGYLMPPRYWTQDKDAKFLRVVSATIRGQEYKLNNFYGKRGGRGRGFHGGCGPMGPGWQGFESQEDGSN